MATFQFDKKKVQPIAPKTAPQGTQTAPKPLAVPVVDVEAQKALERERERERKETEKARTELQAARDQLRQQAIQHELRRHEPKLVDDSWDIFSNAVSSQLDFVDNKIVVKGNPKQEATAYIDEFLTKNSYLQRPTITAGSGARSGGSAPVSQQSFDTSTNEGMTQHLRTKFGIGSKQPSGWIKGA